MISVSFYCAKGCSRDPEQNMSGEESDQIHNQDNTLTDSNKRFLAHECVQYLIDFCGSCR